MRRILSIVCLGVGIALGTSSYALENHYGNTNPTMPDSESGKVNELNVHGRFVYLSSSELYLKIGFMGGTLLFMVLGGWLWTTSESNGGDGAK
jgi:hypothetical protein